MTSTSKLPFENADLPVNERVDDLVSRFTLDEKIELMMQYQPAIDRLSVKPYKHGTEAAHGISWLGEATSFPQVGGLACTWDEDLLRRVGSAIGDEARVFFQRDPAINGLTLWAPTVDMERDPRWGRTEEAYGEDPTLTGELTASLTQGIQGDHPFYLKAVATLKHFLANNNEVNRGSGSSSIDPRNMKEYYQAAFKPAFVKGGAQSMMTAYNSINGTPAILHEDVLKVVKGEWEMDGFIVSDAGDVMGIVNDHHYFDNYTQAVAETVKAGIDSLTDDKEISTKALRDALEEGILTEGDLDRALRNTFRVRFRLGEFDPAERNPYSSVPESVLMSPEHAALSLEAARKSVVLLKNDKGTLPLDSSKLNKVAVIGPLGDVVYRDWYSGSLPYKVTPYEAISRKLEGKAVTYASGNDRATLQSVKTNKSVRIDADANLVVDAEPGEAEVFEMNDWGWNSHTLQTAAGKYVTSADDVHITANADEAFGWFVKEVFHLHAEGDNLLSLRTWNNKRVTASENEAAGLVVAEQSQDANHSEQSELFVKQTVANGLEEAIAAAKEAEVALVFVGNNPLINGKEEIDRPSLMLAESQEQLIREVYKVNPNTVVVVVGSYPFTLNWEQENIPAIVYLAHAGQELGNAVADVLFGDYSPAGRLNMTWYKSEEQLPSILEYDIIKGKRTYMYFDGEPLYPFGHGLTYAEFLYEGVKAKVDQAGGTDELSISLIVTNTSERDAEEVVQLYIHANHSRVVRPIKQLKGFKRLFLKAGEQATVEFKLPMEELAFWDVTRDQFCLEAGTYTIMLGRSSSAIKQTLEITLSGETIPSRDLTLPTAAANYDDYSSVLIDENKEGGTCVRLGSFDSAGELCVPASGWVQYADTDVEGYHTFEVRMSGGSSSGRLDIRLGSVDGEIAGTIDLPASEGTQQAWYTDSCPIRGARGNQAVYICLTGDIRIAHFKFIR